MNHIYNSIQNNNNNGKDRNIPRSDSQRGLNGIGQRTYRSIRNTLIIGWNEESCNLCDKIKDYPALGYNVKGFISVNGIIQDAHYKGIRLLGNLNSLSAWITFFSISELLIAVGPTEKSKINEIISTCKATNTEYRLVSDVYDTVYGNVIHDVYSELFTRHEIGLRRLIDFFGSMVLLILLFPIFLVTAIMIKLESKGSILYSQTRSGKDGNSFRIYKFRSMVQDAEKESGPVWAKKEDPRITKIGRFMRATRIDELPQLINVFKGDMSLIGPRPERPFFVESFIEQIPFYKNRLRIKPGLTGWAQVKWRYDTTLEDVKEKLNYDLFYINNHCIWLDIKILFLTIGTVLLQKGQ